MQRRTFIALAAAGGGTAMLSTKTFLQQAASGDNTARMPALFIGHGSPMNAIEDNPFTQSLRTLGQSMERPKAALIVSAHWLTPGKTSVSMNPGPPTIHDFGGFPDELFAVQYPAPGAPDAAQQTIAAMKSLAVHADHEMGLDHGAWSILRHIYPDADVPVFQLSIDWGKSTAWHYALAQELAALRDKGIMIVGSGNAVHNLSRVNWLDPTGAYDWAQQFDAFVQQKVESGDHQALVDYQQLGAVAQMAHPTNDHYLPMLYTLGARDAKDQLTTVHHSMAMGSISMRSFMLSA